MKNIVETFNLWNAGCRRPDRREHLRLCGWKLWREIDPSYGKPRQQIMEILAERTERFGEYYHVVTLPKVDADGWPYYHAYIKVIGTV